MKYEMILNGGKSIEEQAAHGYVVVSFKPRGFWNDVITVRFKRGCSLLETEGSNWEYELTWNSGDRRRDVVADDVEATTNFIVALEAAKALIVEHFIPEKLEAAYQAEVERKKDVALAAAADEIERLRGILRRAYDCLPDMPAVCCQTVQLAVESAWRSCVYCGSDLVDDPRVAHPYCSGCGAS